MKRYSVFTSVSVIGLFAIGAVLFAAPQPSSIPTQWELDLVYGQPLPIPVTDADGTERLYWYVLYTVSNSSGQDRMFVPDIMLYTDTGKLYSAQDTVYPTVFAEIGQRHPSVFLKDITRIAGPILQGDDNAMHGVAIFPDFDHKARSIDIFFGGFSGETAQVKLPNPVTIRQPLNDGTSAARTVSTVTLHKTLKVSWEYPGVAATRQSVQPRKVSETWVMR